MVKLPVKRNKKIVLMTGALVLFLIGVSIGVYYSNELQVWARHLWSGATSSSQPVVPTPSPDPKDTIVSTSTLKLNTVPDPIPLIYSETLEETQLQEYLKEGAVVLPLDTMFGQRGNV